MRDDYEKIKRIVEKNIYLFLEDIGNSHNRIIICICMEKPFEYSFTCSVFK